MVTPHFRGIFGQATECFCGNFGNLLNIFFILVNYGVTGSASIQKCHFFGFTLLNLALILIILQKMPLIFKKIDNGEAKK